MVLLTILGGFVGVVALLVVSALLRGYVLSILWGWFMVPTLGLPQLSVVQAIGIAIVVSFLTHQVNDYEEKERTGGEKITRAVAMAVLIPFFALLFGYIAHQFM